MALTKHLGQVHLSRDDLSCPSGFQESSGVPIVTGGQFPNLIRLVVIKFFLNKPKKNPCKTLCELKLCRQKYEMEKEKGFCHV